MCCQWGTGRFPWKIPLELTDAKVGRSWHPLHLSPCVTSSLWKLHVVPPDPISSVLSLQQPQNCTLRAPGASWSQILTPPHGQPGLKLIVCRPGAHYWSCSMQLHFLGLIWESKGESLQEQEEGGFQHWWIPGVCRWFSQQGMLAAYASSPSHHTAGEWIFSPHKASFLPLKMCPSVLFHLQLLGPQCLAHPLTPALCLGNRGESKQGIYFVGFAIE